MKNIKEKYSIKILQIWVPVSHNIKAYKSCNFLEAKFALKKKKSTFVVAAMMDVILYNILVKRKRKIYMGRKKKEKKIN